MFATPEHSSFWPTVSQRHRTVIAIHRNPRSASRGTGPIRRPGLSKGTTIVSVPPRHCGKCRKCALAGTLFADFTGLPEAGRVRTISRGMAPPAHRGLVLRPAHLHAGRAATCRRALRAICRTVGVDFLICLGDLTVRHLEDLAKHEHRHGSHLSSRMQRDRRHPRQGTFLLGSPHPPPAALVPRGAHRYLPKAGGSWDAGVPYRSSAQQKSIPQACQGRTAFEPFVFSPTFRARTYPW